MASPQGPARGDHKVPEHEEEDTGLGWRRPRDEEGASESDMGLAGFSGRGQALTQAIST